MRSLSAVLLSSFFAILLVGCGSKERAGVSSSTESYDVVSEGDASGVASTINGPGEVTPPTMTATNVDTTTNLAITGQAAVPTATSGNLAGALPATTAAPAPVYIPPSNPPIGIMRRTPPSQPPAQTNPPVTSRPVPAQTVPAAETAPPPPAATQPPPTDTAQTDTAQTDTTQTETTQQQMPAKKKPDQKKKDEPPPPPPPEQTDTTTTNPG